MICPKCKNNIQPGETPCKTCGAKIVWKPVQPQQMPQQNVQKTIQSQQIPQQNVQETIQSQQIPQENNKNISTETNKEKKVGTSTLTKALSIIIPVIIVLSLIAFGAYKHITKDVKFRVAKNHAGMLVDAASFYFTEQNYENLDDLNYQPKNSATIDEINPRYKPTGCTKVTKDNGKINYKGCIFDGYKFDCVDGVVKYVD